MKKSSLKLLDVRINVGAITKNSVNLLFYRIYLNGKKLPLSEVVVLS